MTLIDNLLRAEGFTERSFVSAQQSIIRLCTQFLKCPIGQWILKTHQDEHNEYALLIHKDNTCITRIIDRTFLDGEKRWIIDFKTGQENSESQEKYYKQLNEYASILSIQYQDPIYCGLYFLANNHWVTWAVSEIT